jgi:hypothetical protein
MIAIERALISPLVPTRMAMGLAQRARPSCARIVAFELVVESLQIGLDWLAPRCEYPSCTSLCSGPAVRRILSPRYVGARRRIWNFAGRSHEHGLKKNRGGHGAEERKSHHLAHARCARISREPEAPKGGRCC